MSETKKNVCYPLHMQSETMGCFNTCIYLTVLHILTIYAYVSMYKFMHTWVHLPTEKRENQVASAQGTELGSSVRAARRFKHSQEEQQEVLTT